MTYVALYREWRPQLFSEVVGQEHVTRTLLNALQQGWINHAYLFCGPRGTGKTSVAKILAKAVNCINLENGEPCNQCFNCQSIIEGSSLDVLEIDAASNRGIDEIRDLRERVQYVPAEGRFRIYIIDEVHMLTTEAFNALLKTLEEPPRHVIFIMATTEVHKVPATILSRCQRFNFHRITMPDLISRLKLVANHQNIEITDEALMAIVKAAEGGLRDALSLLDQCIGYADSVINIEDVNQVLGVVSEDVLASMVDGLASDNSSGLIQLVEEVVNQGKDIRKFTQDLIGYMRDLLLIKIGGAGNSLVINSTNLKRLEDQASRWSKDSIIGLIRYFTRVESDMKWAIQPRWMLEAALVEASYKLGIDEIDELRNRVETLERLVKDRDYREFKKLEMGYQADVQDEEKKSEDAKKPEVKSKEISVQKRAQKQVEFLENEAKAGDKADSNDELKSNLDISFIRSQWKEFMQKLRKQNIALHALVLEAEPVMLKEEVLELAFKKGRSFHCQKVDEPNNKKIVEEILKQVFNSSIKIHCKMKDFSEGKSSNIGLEGTEKLSEDPWQDPLVKRAAEIFGEDRIKIRDS